MSALFPLRTTTKRLIPRRSVLETNMDYSKLNLNKYPRFQRKGTVPGQYDQSRAYSSPHLKPGAAFPVLGENSELNRLSESLGTRIASMHTALTLSEGQLSKIRVVPDSGSLQDGAAWLQPHVDSFNIVSFDTESCQATGGLTFCVFGTMSGHVLLVDHRKVTGNTLHPSLRPLVEGKLVLGSGLSRNDSKMLAGVPCRLGDTLPFSRSIQLHQLYPYSVQGYVAGTKPGLKHIPEMIFGHCYGPLGLVTRKGTGLGNQQRAGFPQPFEWPDWLYPTKMYSFRSGPPKSRTTCLHVQRCQRSLHSPHAHDHASDGLRGLGRRHHR